MTTFETKINTYKLDVRYFIDGGLTLPEIIEHLALNDTFINVDSLGKLDIVVTMLKGSNKDKLSSVYSSLEDLMYEKL